MDVDRQVPMTFNRAATALVVCRSGLEKVRSEIELALRILRSFDEEGRRAPGELQIDRAALRRLEHILDRVEDAQRAFEMTTTSSPEREPLANSTRSLRGSRRSRPTSTTLANVYGPTKIRSS